MSIADIFREKAKGNPELDQILKTIDREHERENALYRDKIRRQEIADKKAAAELERKRIEAEKLADLEHQKEKARQAAANKSLKLFRWIAYPMDYCMECGIVWATDEKDAINTLINSPLFLEWANEEYVRNPVIPRVEEVDCSQKMVCIGSHYE